MGADSDDKLIRQAAGTYRSADERFEVSQQGGQWFVSDVLSADDFGQPILTGPFATLAQARHSIGELRMGKPRKAKPPPPPRAAKAAKSAKGAKPKAASKTAEPTWLERLPVDERRRAEKAIGAMERLGVSDAEALIRRDREGLLPAVARRLIGARLREVVDRLPERDRPAVRRALLPIVKVLTEDGLERAADLPGWALVERAPDGGAPRTIQVTRGDIE